MHIKIIIKSTYAELIVHVHIDISEMSILPSKKRNPHLVNTTNPELPLGARVFLSTKMKPHQSLRKYVFLE